MKWARGLVVVGLLSIGSVLAVGQCPTPHVMTDRNPVTGEPGGEFIPQSFERQLPSGCVETGTDQVTGEPGAALCPGWY